MTNGKTPEFKHKEEVEGDLKMWNSISKPLEFFVSQIKTPVTELENIKQTQVLNLFEIPYKNEK